MVAQNTAATVACRTLIEKSDMGRFSRASDRDTVTVAWEQGGFTATVTSAKEGHLYNVRIQIDGRRAFRCSCQDHHFRAAKSHLPCKHVIRTAVEVLDQTELEAKAEA